MVSDSHVSEALGVSPHLSPDNLDYDPDLESTNCPYEIDVKEVGNSDEGGDVDEVLSQLPPGFSLIDAPWGWFTRADKIKSVVDICQEYAQDASIWNINISKPSEDFDNE